MAEQQGPDREAAEETADGGRAAADWRRDVVSRIVAALAIAGPAVVALWLALRPAPRFDGPAIAVIAVNFGLIGLRFVPRERYRLRAAGVVALPVVAAVTLISRLGFSPGPALVAVSAAILAAMFFGRSASFFIFGVVGATYVVTGALVSARYITVKTDAFDVLVFRNWARVAFTVTVCGIVLMVAIDMVLRHMQRSRASAIAAREHLERERAERATLEAERRKAAEEWQQAGPVLVDLARSEALASGDLSVAFREICVAGARALDVERCGVWLLDEAGKTLRCLRLYERSLERHSSGQQIVAAELPSYFAALRSQRSVAAHDAVNDPRTRELRTGYLEPLGITSMLDSPIHMGGHLVGVVCHEHVGPMRVWSEVAQSLAGSIADLTARTLTAAERKRREIEVREARDLLGQLYRRLESAKEEERRHIARELHDDLGQVMTALKLRFQMLSGARPAESVDQQAREAVKLVDGMIARTRQLCVDLRPPLLDELGLLPALRNHLETQARLGGLELTLDAEPLEERFQPEIEIAAFRVLQEATTNALKHAHASRITVKLGREGSNLSLSIADDGRGFLPEEALRRSLEGRHMGLVGMRERVQALGGEFRLTSQPGEGTQIDVRLPFVPSPNGALAAPT